MPGVLTEIGFMSNPEELRYMCSEKGQTEIARSLFNAVRDYVDFVKGIQLIEEGPASPASDVKDDSAATAQPAKTVASATKDAAASPAGEPEKRDAKIGKGYTIQILASTKPLRPNDWQFKSYKNKVIELRSKGRYRYKYCVGRYRTEAEAKADLAVVRKSFHDAYVVRYEGNSVAR